MRSRVSSHPPDRLVREQFISPQAVVSIHHQHLHESFAFHWHDFYEIACILGGHAQHNLNGSVFPVERGTVFVLTPADFHALQVPDGETLELYNVIFSDDLLSEDLRQLLFSNLRPLVAFFDQASAPEIEAPFHRIWEETQAPQVGQQLLIQSLLQQVLIAVLRQHADLDMATAPRQDVLINPAIQKALPYIQYHFWELLTLAAAARVAHVTPNYFSECFHASTGTSFQDYLQGLRLRFAASLLGVSSLPVTEIAAAAGFSTLAHFDRAFKRRFGTTPGKYRQRRAS
jgi:AraC-like DNA-binding protein